MKLLSYVWTHPLNACGRVAAIARVVRWQIGSRLLHGPIALPYVGKTFLFASRGMTGATGNWYCGLHEPSEMGFVLHTLRAGDHFVDIGANVGSYTVLASGGVGARTTAVEPIPLTFAHLRRNVTLNSLGERVRCWGGGISDREGTLRFTSSFDTVNHVAVAGEEVGAIEVPVTTLDALVGDDVPAVIKIDVEGHESAVLAGGRATLADQRLFAVCMETNGSGARYGVSDSELIAVMHVAGFAPYTYEPLSRRLTAGHGSTGNTIFVRSVEAVQERIETAPRYSLVNRVI